MNGRRRFSSFGLARRENQVCVVNTWQCGQLKAVSRTEGGTYFMNVRSPLDQAKRSADERGGEGTEGR